MSFVIDRSVEIAAPAGVVWEVITDLPAYGQWNPFVPECHSTLQPGTSIEMRVNLGGRNPRRQVEWMTAYEPNLGFSYRMKPVPLGALSSARTHRIEPVSTTHCRYHSHFELMGWLMPLVRLVMLDRLDAGFEGMAQGIRRRAEQLWAQRKN